MLFKEMGQNYPVYILNRQDVTLTAGKVTSKSLPHMSLNPQKTLGPTEMVIDLTVEAGGRTATYEIPESSAVAFAGDTVIATDKAALVHEIEAMKSSAEQALASVERQREILGKASALLEEADPVYRDRQETEKRFTKIEGAVDEMKSMLAGFIREFRN